MAADSPFRFIVLDDPIQAMDPAKIDGFVQVLSEVVQTHQVIVFSHDDRLASVIRDTGVDARLVEVVRGTDSKVSIHDNVNPALRAVDDVFALVKDERLPDDIRARVLPGLFRIAVDPLPDRRSTPSNAWRGAPGQSPNRRGRRRRRPLRGWRWRYTAIRVQTSPAGSTRRRNAVPH